MCKCSSSTTGDQGQQFGAPTIKAEFGLGQTGNLIELALHEARAVHYKSRTPSRNALEPASTRAISTRRELPRALASAVKASQRTF